MNIIVSLYHALLYRPLLNVLVLLSALLPGRDFGVAIILLTLGIRSLLFPLSARAARAQKKIIELQPKVEELQQRFKDNREVLTKKLFEFYRKEGLHPLAPLLPLLLQLPLLLALYQVLWKGMAGDQLSQLYSFVPRPEDTSVLFLGLVNLREAFPFLAFLGGTLQFLQSKGITRSQQHSQGSGGKGMLGAQKIMTFTTPLVLFFIFAQLPSALSLYWISTTAFSLWEQRWINKHP